MVAAAPVNTRQSRPLLYWPVVLMKNPIMAGASDASPLARPFIMPDAVDMDGPGISPCSNVQATGVPMVQNATARDSNMAERYYCSVTAPR